MRRIAAQRSRVLSEISPGCLRRALTEVFALPWTIVPGPAGTLQTSFCPGLAGIRALSGSRLFPNVARSLILDTVDARLARTPAFSTKHHGASFAFEAKASRLRKRLQTDARTALNDFGAFGLVALADGLPLDTYAPDSQSPDEWEREQRQRKQALAKHATTTSSELAELLKIQVEGATLLDGTWRAGEGDWMRSLGDAAVPNKSLKTAINYLRSQQWKLTHRRDGTFEIAPCPIFTAYAERPHTSNERDTARSIAATIVRAAVAKLNWVMSTTDSRMRPSADAARELICNRLVKAAKAYGLRGLLLELDVPGTFA